MWGYLKQKETNINQLVISPEIVRLALLDIERNLNSFGQSLITLNNFPETLLYLLNQPSTNTKLYDRKELNQQVEINHLKFYTEQLSINNDILTAVNNKTVQSNFHRFIEVQDVVKSIHHLGR